MPFTADDGQELRSVFIVRLGADRLSRPKGIERRDSRGQVNSSRLKTHDRENKNSAG